MQPIQQQRQYTGIDRIVSSIGSVPSLLIHTLAFAGFFIAALFGIASWEIVLLVLTTLVSLEAIYLAIFIQITVNRHTQSLKEVEEDIDEIQEDFEEMSEEEKGVHIERQKKDKAAKAKASDIETLEKLSKDVEKMLKELAALKKARGTQE